MNGGDESLPLGDPPVLEHSTPTGATEVAQRLVAFPFTPPDVKLKAKEALSSSNDWFTKHDKNKIDDLGSLDFTPRPVHKAWVLSRNFTTRQPESKSISLLLR